MLKVMKFSVLLNLGRQKGFGRTKMVEKEPAKG